MARLSGRPPESCFRGLIAGRFAFRHERALAASAWAFLQKRVSVMFRLVDMLCTPGQEFAWARPRANRSEAKTPFFGGCGRPGAIPMASANIGTFQRAFAGMSSLVRLLRSRLVRQTNQPRAGPRRREPPVDVYVKSRHRPAKGGPDEPDFDEEAWRRSRRHLE